MDESQGLEEVEKLLRYTQTYYQSGAGLIADFIISPAVGLGLGLALALFKQSNSYCTKNVVSNCP